VVVDGQLGPATLSTAALCNEDVVVKFFIRERDARFIALAAEHPNDRHFLDGWEQRAIGI
jgi:hypothetical protein